LLYLLTTYIEYKREQRDEREVMGRNKKREKTRGEKSRDERREKKKRTYKYSLITPEMNCNHCIAMRCIFWHSP